ncbi:hypothetical protein ACHAXT_002831 [Thalassiosira profunda]
MDWDALRARHDRQRRALRRRLAPRPERGPRLDAIAIVRAALRLAVGASTTTAAVLMLQLIWVVLRTPRLPPPPLSGADFVRKGSVVEVSGENKECAQDVSSTDDDAHVSRIATPEQKEFRLVLVGDSPVEGIGNSHHEEALGGQTARAFAKIVRPEGHDRVRYWAYGKCGLTARGIKEEMVPLMQRVADDNGDSDVSAVHAVILLCGVNNVLDPLSTPSSFYSEVKSLLRSIRIYPGLKDAKLMVLGLPDFAKLPFLPWPLCFALGLRARKMQRMLELAVRECQLEERQRGENARTVMVNIPDVQDVIGSIGYHRYESSNDTDKTNRPGPLKKTLVHPLLNYLSDRSLRDQTKLASLSMGDFLASDGFHPGGYGTEYVGSLISEAYRKLVASNTAT